jgi:hypothetical protein
VRCAGCANAASNADPILQITRFVEVTTFVDGDATLRRPRNAFFLTFLSLSLSLSLTFSHSNYSAYPLYLPSVISLRSKLLFSTLELGLKNSNLVSTLHSCFKRISHKRSCICIHPSTHCPTVVTPISRPIISTFMNVSEFGVSSLIPVYTR